MENPNIRYDIIKWILTMHFVLQHLVGQIVSYNLGRPDYMTPCTLNWIPTTTFRRIHSVLESGKIDYMTSCTLNWIPTTQLKEDSQCSRM